MTIPSDSDPAVAEYYATYPEEARLDCESSRLEYERTQEILRRVLPPPPARVIDVGGAAGAYSLWLAYFHRPEDLFDELCEADLRDVRVLGVEGPGWTLPDFEERWSDPDLRADVLHVARALEAEPSIVGASAHLLGVGRKP